MRNLAIVNTAVFLSVAFLHAVRVAYEAPFVFGSVEVPMWLSGLAVVLLVILAWFNWRSLGSATKVDWLILLLSLIVVDIVVLLYSWATQISYWNISGDTFLWFVIIDLILIGIILHPIRKATRK
jgi:hypothetical protein